MKSFLLFVIIFSSIHSFSNPDNYCNANNFIEKSAKIVLDSDIENEIDGCNKNCIYHISYLIPLKAILNNLTLNNSTPKTKISTYLLDISSDFFKPPKLLFV